MNHANETMPVGSLTMYVKLIWEDYTLKYFIIWILKPSAGRAAHQQDKHKEVKSLEALKRQEQALRHQIGSTGLKLKCLELQNLIYSFCKEDFRSKLQAEVM